MNGAHCLVAQGLLGVREQRSLWPHAQAHSRHPGQSRLTHNTPHNSVPHQLCKSRAAGRGYVAVQRTKDPFLLVLCKLRAGHQMSGGQQHQDKIQADGGARWPVPAYYLLAREVQDQRHGGMF